MKLENLRIDVNYSSITDLYTRLCVLARKIGTEDFSDFNCTDAQKEGLANDIDIALNFLEGLMKKIDEINAMKL